MKKESFIHKLYAFLGHVFCRVMLVWWKCRDAVAKPTGTVILCVAHPDDDTLFFHSFIKEHKPYVVLLFTGWSLRRVMAFRKAMHLYGVRYRIYDTVSSGAYKDKKRREVTEQHIRESLSIGKFQLCATHNSTGEYGHPTHRLVHEAVINVVGNQMPVLCPVSSKQICDFPLEEAVYAEKKQIFEKIYSTEAWVLEQYAVWAENEHLIRVEI